VRVVGVVTVARSDYGIYYPLLSAIKKDPDLRLHLIVSGMHLSPEFGLTVKDIEADGFPIGDRVEMLLSSDTPEGIAKSMGLAAIGYAQSFSRFRPDILVLLGDRFEMHAAAVAALPFKIPLAHIHGGESTEGLIDEAIRHSITKFSHLHFASTQIYGDRIMRMGEEPWRVVVSGAPSLDFLQGFKALSRSELETQLGLKFTKPTILVTYHPVTLEHEDTEIHIRELIAALEKFDCTVVFTYPNADTSGRQVIQKIQEVALSHSDWLVFVNLGQKNYFSVMSQADAMVGNSSSGIIEAASFKLPVVNIGNRQRGRVRGKNVIDVAHDRAEIVTGIKKALSPEFRSELRDLANPYGAGGAATRIVQKLKGVSLDFSLICKRFHDYQVQ